jgi:HEAT repeat protein
MKKLLGLFTISFYVLFVVQLHAADVAELAQKLKDKDSDTRRDAARALAEMGAEAKPAVPALVAALKDSDLYVRRFAAQALGEIGPAAEAGVPNLTAILKDSKEKKEAQEAAALALGKIGPAGLTALIAVIKDHDKEMSVRRNAIIGLSKMGTDAKPAISTLIDEMNGGTKGNKKGPIMDSLKSDIVSALGEIATSKDENAVKAIESLTEGKGGKKDKNLVKAVQDAVRKIKMRN